jgi:two-component system, NtrC family, sensor kinase
MACRFAFASINPQSEIHNPQSPSCCFTKAWAPCHDIAAVRTLKLTVSLKLMICLIGSLALIFAILGYKNLRQHRQDLEELTVQSADRISDTIRRGTRFSMLRNHREEVYQTITTIGGQPGINKIRIFNKEGMISFSTDGREVNTYVDKQAEACYACHAQEEPLQKLNRPDRVRVYQESSGQRVLGMISPIENEPGCYEADCHAHPESQQVLGVLDVTMSLANVDQRMAEGQWALTSNLIGAVLLISLAFGGLIWMVVYRPVRRLIAGTQRVAEGDLEHKIDVSSRDEFGEFAESFNRMTGELQRANEESKEWARTLEVKVEEKTAEVKSAHQRMIQVERMASMGQLAAIVAHEINNPLAGILTYARLLSKRVGRLDSRELEDIKEDLDMIAGESARCGEIVKGLLQFARQGARNFQPTDVNTLVVESLRLVKHKTHLLGVETETCLAPDLPRLVCDGQEIRQALVAILINACEAVTPGEGLVQVGTLYRKEPEAIEIWVKDNGVGMDEETQQHIFEPFFTTKEQGKGVGLGLAAVSGIVSQHAGEVEVQSSPGNGCTLTLVLPLSQARHRAAQSKASAV